MRPASYPRSYWGKRGSNNLVVVGRGDEAARRRLKARGYTKLRTENLTNAVYQALRALEPGSYVANLSPIFALPTEFRSAGFDMTRAKSY